jgi:hypothetical protein
MYDENFEKNEPLTFDGGAFKFINDLSNAAGDDLIYSLALENGNLFMCVTAYPSMTKKRFDTGNERLLFLINPDEYSFTQDKMVSKLAEMIAEHVTLVDEVQPDASSAIN